MMIVSLQILFGAFQCGFAVKCLAKYKHGIFLLMNQSQPVEPFVVGRPRFWVAPLLAGCCFSMGFGVADRVVSLQRDQQPAPTQRFTPSTFPGESLKTLRSIHQDAPTLQVDLAAITLALPEREQAVNPPIALGVETDLALQLPPAEDRAWTAPAWSDPDADLPPTALSTDPIDDMELEKPSSTILLAPPPEFVPSTEASLLIVEPEPAGFVAENDARLLMPMQPLTPPSQP